MSVVDDRIINMEFRNRDFLQNINQSARGLTGLEKTITNLGKTKGMAALEGSTQRVTAKFSALQVAGVAAIGTIATKATLMAGNFLKGFTIQPIMDGFREYQTGLESVQTIMANTGKPVRAVNKALDQLNQYADQTIYNFAEMARNVGTFTAAGVDLKRSVESIKGIANLAALSGSNSQQASTAMYQLSQAIAAGKVGLQDWNSVVNAGMGGKVFQTALTRTAQNMGSLTREAVKLEGPLKKLKINGESFRESISAKGEQWMSGEVLVETLKQISGAYTQAELRAKGYTKAQAKEIDQLARRAFDAATQIKTLPQLVGVIKESLGSTFAEGFRIIIGDFKQSKKLWGDVGYAIIGPRGWLTKIQEGFKDTLKGWAEAGGRNAVINGFKNLFGGLGRVVGAFRDAFVDIFPPATGNQLADLSKAFERFTEFLVPSEKNIENLKSTFKGFFAILHVGWSILTGIAGAIASFFGAMFVGSTGARSGILTLTGSIGSILSAIDSFLTKGGRMHKFLSGIGMVAGAALKPLVTTISAVVDGFSSLFSGDGLGAAMDGFGRAKTVFSDFVSEIVEGLDTLTMPLDPVKDKIAEWAFDLFGPFDGVVAKLDEYRWALVEALGLDEVLPTKAGFMSYFEDIKAKVVDFYMGFKMAADPMQEFGDAIDWVIQKAEELAKKIDFSGKLESIKGAASGLLDKASGGSGDMSDVGANAGAKSAEAMAVAGEKSAEAFSKLKAIVFGIGDALGSMMSMLGAAASWIGSKLKDLFPQDALEWASLLNALIAGALIKKLLFSKGVFSTLSDSIKQIGDAVTESFGAMTETLGTMQNSIKAETIKNIAIGVALLAASLLVLSFIPADKLKQGLAALVILLGAMAITLKTLGIIDSKVKVVAIAAGLVLVATAVLILAGAVAALAFIPLDNLQRGIGALATVLGILTVSLLMLSGNSAKIIAAGGAMVLMAAAIDIIVLAILALAFIPMEALQQGLTAIAIGLGIMTVALLMLSGSSAKALAAGGAMIMIALALDILVVAITALGLLPWDVVSQGLKAIAIGMAIMVLSLLLISSVGPKALAAGAAMIMFSIALNMLMSVILVLGVTPWETISRGLTAMGIALAILLVAGAAAMLIIPGLAALAATILAMGAAMLMAGAGMALFGAGLALIAVAGVAVIGVIAAAIAAFIVLLPQIAIQMAAAFVSFIQAIALAAPKIRKALGVIIKNLLGTVRDAIPEIGKLFSQLIETGLDVIEDAIPDYIETGLTIIRKFLNSVEKNVPDIVDSAANIAIFFIKELGEKAGDFAQAGLDLIVDVIDGINDAIENSDRVRDAARNLARTFVDELRETLQDLISTMPLPDIPMPKLPKWVKDLGNGFAAGASNGAGRITRPGSKPREDPLVTALRTAGQEVALAIEASVRILTNSTSGKAYDLTKGAKGRQKYATYKAVQAEEQDISATRAMDAAEARLERAQNIKNKAKRKKAVKAARKQMAGAKKQRTSADRIAAAAEAAQEKADLEAQKARDEVAYDKADWAGKGDIRSQQGEDLADRAQALLASAQAKADEAKRLSKGTKKDQAQAKQLRAEAAREAAEAKKLALEAQAAQREALSAYAEARKVAAQEVFRRMEDVRKQQANRLWEDEYEKASSETKIQMLEKRAAENEAAAAKAEAEMQKALAAGSAIEQIIASGGTISEAQLEELDAALTAAETNSQLAWQAADQAEADREAIKRLQEEIAGGTGGNTGGSPGPSITPSRSVLDDAANAVDRYTESVMQAESMTQSAPKTTQFVQNNYSPEALPASTIYRQSRNLISSAELKMVDN